MAAMLRYLFMLVTSPLVRAAARPASHAHALQAADAAEDVGDLAWSQMLQGAFNMTYEAQGQLWSIYGLDPLSGSKGAPVYLFLSGDYRNHELAVGPRSNESRYLVMMAERGFVAAMVESLPAPRHCGNLTEAAALMLEYNDAAVDTSSALAKVCGRVAADCSRGVGVHGFTLGGIYATLSFQQSRFVTASVSWAFFNIVFGWDSCCGIHNSSCCGPPMNEPGHDPGGTLLTCLTDEELLPRSPRSRRRHVLGHMDMFGAGYDDTFLEVGHAAPRNERFGAFRQCKLASGYDCGAMNNCFMADGSGYAVPEDLDHEILPFDQPAATCEWGLNATLDWLDRTVRMPLPREGREQF